jgi:hypothetical protein
LNGLCRKVIVGDGFVSWKAEHGCQLEMFSAVSCLDVSDSPTISDARNAGYELEAVYRVVGAASRSK